jgi:hypothetical protein
VIVVSGSPIRIEKLPLSSLVSTSVGVFGDADTERRSIG